jgi:hypothetical protein
MTRDAAATWLQGATAALLIFPAPLVVQWLLLVLAGREGSNGYLGMLSLLLPFAVAGAGFVLFPAPGRAKAVLAILLVPLLFFAVVWFGFSYVCSAYGDCL